MIPEFEGARAIKAMVVERKDKPGALGIYVRGGRFVCALPAGYDGRVSLTVHQGYVLVAHPELPPLKCDPATGSIELIEARHIDGHIPGRMKLLTQ
jgi:hypothetical protein